MLTREELHEKLVDILGSRNVYYQPPESLKIKYPCIIYSFENAELLYANNKPYGVSKEYSLTVVDEDPDSEIADKMLLLPLCKFTGSYQTEGLNHYKFSLFNK